MAGSVRKDHNRASMPPGSGSGGGDSSTINTSSMSTLVSDPHELFHHSITNLDSFSTSLDFDRHLPSVEAREDFLSNLMDEEEINPGEEETSLQSSFAYDMMECSIPARLGTIVDQAEEDEEEEGEPSSCALSKTSNHHHSHHTTGGSSSVTAAAAVKA